MLIVDFLASNVLVIVIVAVVLLVAFKSVRIANQYERGVVFRLGKYSRTAGPGIYIVWVLIEWQNQLDLRTVTAAGEQQAGITRGNVPVKVNTVVSNRLVDPDRAVLEAPAVAN